MRGLATPIACRTPNLEGLCDPSSVSASPSHLLPQGEKGDSGHMTHRNLVVLTGAGISAESGVPTFRASDGLWCGHRVEDVATPEGYAADPALAQDDRAAPAQPR